MSTILLLLRFLDNIFILSLNDALRFKKEKFLQVKVKTSFCKNKPTNLTFLN